MVLALEPVHEYFTSDGHLPLAVFDSSRNDDANDSDGFFYQIDGLCCFPSWHQIYTFFLTRIDLQIALNCL